MLTHRQVIDRKLRDARLDYAQDVYLPLDYSPPPIEYLEHIQPIRLNTIINEFTRTPRIDAETQYPFQLNPITTTNYNEMQLEGMFEIMSGLSLLCRAERFQRGRLEEAIWCHSRAITVNEELKKEIIAGQILINKYKQQLLAFSESAGF